MLNPSYTTFLPISDNRTIIEPLTEMLRKNVPIEPNEERVAAFNALKAILSSHQFWQCPPMMDVDCSAFGIGAVAQQWQNGESKVIEYASRTLNRAERSYCATRRELLAMIFALKHFRSYFLGNHFVCRVDHMALKYYQATPEPLGQQARFLDFLAEFDFELQFRPGREYTNCDSLSRVRPSDVDWGNLWKQCNRRVASSHVSSVTTKAQRRHLQSDSSQCDADDHGEGFSPAQAADPPGQACTRRTRKQKVKAGLLNRTAPQALASGVQNWCSQFLAEEQRKDPDIGPAVEWVTAGQRPPW